MWKLLQFIFNFSAILANREEKIFFKISDLLILIVINLCWMQPAIANESSIYDNNKSGGVIFPQTQLYPHYIANPLRPSFSFQNISYSKTEITDTSLHRYDLKVGGHLGIYRSQPEKTNRGWQLTFGAGFHGEFDPASSEDNVGWDGIFSLSLEMRFNKTLAHRFGTQHISSHVGDELIERTGIKRINYTRQEIRYGMMWFMSPHWQSYIEIGKAYDLRNKLIQKSWRSELGFQYENKKYWMSNLGWYLAADFSSYEENDWDINTSLHLGIITTKKERNYRFGFEFYEGRSPLGEFFQANEKYIGIGLWIDI